MDQMHLPQVGLRWIARNPRKVLNGGAGMGIALDAPSCDQDNLVDGLFAEPVVRVAADCDNNGSALVCWVHETIVAHHCATSTILSLGDPIRARLSSQYRSAGGRCSVTLRQQNFSRHC
ncbi:hypothetical protein RCH11_003775 [Glaciihabitans sp. GrIS 2.15]|nr:hypothetical protein [Glaciihabitans sp. GrIS 2.15]